MKIILQRVSYGSIVINGGEPQKSGAGLVALVGIKEADDQKTVDYMLEKMLNLRIFEDNNGAMNLSLIDVGGELMLVPNFTLYANSKKGRRPSFVDAAPPSHSEPLFRYFVESAEESGVTIIAGEFGADMQIDLCNNGPVTIILDSDEIMPRK